MIKLNEGALHLKLDISEHLPKRKTIRKGVDSTDF